MLELIEGRRILTTPPLKKWIIYAFQQIKCSWSKLLELIPLPQRKLYVNNHINFSAKKENKQKQTKKPHQNTKTRTKILCDVHTAICSHIMCNFLPVNMAAHPALTPNWFCINFGINVAKPEVIRPESIGHLGKFLAE